MLPKEDRFAAPHTPRPRYRGAAPLTFFRRVAATDNFSTQGRARPPSRTRRVRASVLSAPS